MAGISLEVDVSHPPTRVWRALTDARLLGEWFMPTDLEPREGGQFALDPDGLPGFRGPVAGHLTELVPPQRMVMLWRCGTRHSRVVWELTGTAGGCRVRVEQERIGGGPLRRRRALRATYTRLFTAQLPVALDRLASGEIDLGGTDLAGAGATPLRTAIPRQRRATAGLVVNAWPAERWVEPADSLATDVPEPEPAGAGHAAAVAPSPPRWRGRAGVLLGRGRRSLAVLPRWGRTAAIGGAIAVLAAVAVLAALNPTAAPVPADGQAPGPQDGRGGPGMAVQPGDAPAPPGTAAPPSRLPAAQPGPAADPATAGTTPGSPAVAARPGGSSGPGTSPVPAGPELTAQHRSAAYGLLGLGGRTVTVTVSNPGPGAAPTWQLTMDVGEQAVTEVAGAAFTREGTLAIFTPAGGALAAGDGTAFSFRIPSSGLLGLGGTNPPTDCMINDNPCD